jgi:UTP--glucose-1-phosphate uridylyltransferase
MKPVPTPAAPAVKGVILAAGYGSRFLPVTKTIPKEMLPLVDVPSIQFIVDEFVASGIRDVLIITSRRKKSLEDYFDREIELESSFRKDGAHAKLSRIEPPPVHVCFTRQEEMRGTAHALMLCERFTAYSPFVVAYPDDILVSDPPCSRTLIDTWQLSVTPEHPAGCCVLSVAAFPDGDISRYGIIDPEPRGGLLGVRQMVEKPPPGREPSRLVSLGRYLYTPEIFPVLHEMAARHTGGEFYQTGPINHLAASDKVLAVEFQGARYDTGEPLGFLKATVEYALSRDDLRPQFLPYLREISQRFKE